MLTNLRIGAKGDVEDRLRGNGKQAAYRHGPFDGLERQAFGPKVAFIGSQKSAEMAPGGVAADEELVIAAAIFVDVLVRPGESTGHVADVLGMHHLGRQAVVGAHDTDAM